MRSFSRHSLFGKQERFRTRRCRGFTAIEVLLVIGLMAVAAGVTIPMFRQYQINSDLDTATQHLVQSLRAAQTLSQAGKFDSAWGVYFPDGTLFAGDAYAERNPDRDIVFPLPPTIETTGLTEVVFTRIDGLPLVTGSVLVTSSVTDSYRQIDIDRNGVITVGDIITPAHSEGSSGSSTSSTGSTGSSGSAGSSLPSSSSQASSVPGGGGSSESSSLPGGGAGSSASSTSGSGSSASSSIPGGGGGSSSSSVSSGTSSSSSSEDMDADDDDNDAPGEGDNLPCDTFYRLENSHSLRTVRSNEVKIRILGSMITYGSGGPRIPVRAALSVDGGSAWTDLFNGRTIEEGDEYTLSNLPANVPIVLRFNGRYSWLFNKTFRSDSDDGHTYVLRNGDPLPNYPAFGDWKSLQRFMRDRIGDNGRIRIGSDELLIITELGALDRAADFQSAAVLLKFKAKPYSCATKSMPRVKVRFDRLENTGAGDGTRTVFVGTQSVAFTDHQSIPLVDGSGNTIIDGSLVPVTAGLALERGNGWIHIVNYGYTSGVGKKIIDARVSLKQSHITSISNDPQNPSASPLDGIVNDTAQGDEFILESNMKKVSLQTRVITENDGIYIYWAPGRPTTGSASSGPASSSSASAGASSSSSSASSAPLADSCAVPYRFDPDGTVTLKGKADVTVKIAGSESTYGLRGPRIAVRSRISFNGGNTWKELFGFRALRGNEFTVFRDVGSGSQILLSFNGRYSWVFNRTVESGRGDTRVRVLRHGETFGGLPAIVSRGQMKAFLRNLLDDEGRARLGLRDLAILVQLSDSSSPNYQDAAMVLSIDKASSTGGCGGGASSSSSSSISSSSAGSATSSSSSSSPSTDNDSDNDGITGSLDWCPYTTQIPEAIPTEFLSFERYALTSPRSGNSVPIFRVGPRKKVSSYSLADTHGCSCSDLLNIIQDRMADRLHRFAEHPVLYRSLKNLFAFYVDASRKFGCGDALMRIVSQEK